jgi:hypothetical protein
MTGIMIGVYLVGAVSLVSMGVSIGFFFGLHAQCGGD